MVSWIQDMFSVGAKDLKAYLNIYPQQDENKIKKFWSKLTGIPVNRFGKSFVKPLSRRYKKNNLYYGTIKIVVPKSVDIKHKIFGWINAAMKSKIDTEVNIDQKKWLSLRQLNNLTPINLLKK